MVNIRLSLFTREDISEVFDYVNEINCDISNDKFMSVIIDEISGTHLSTRYSYIELSKRPLITFDPKNIDTRDHSGLDAFLMSIPDERSDDNQSLQIKEEIERKRNIIYNKIESGGFDSLTEDEYTFLIENKK